MIFYMYYPKQDTKVFVTPIMKHQLEQEIAQWVIMLDWSYAPLHHEWMSHVLLNTDKKIELYIFNIWIYLRIFSCTLIW